MIPLVLNTDSLKSEPKCLEAIGYGQVFKYSSSLFSFLAFCKKTHILAIWLLPTENVYGKWPASGEIDIVESRGSLVNFIICKNISFYRVYYVIKVTTLSRVALTTIWAVPFIGQVFYEQLTNGYVFFSFATFHWF